MKRIKLPKTSNLVAILTIGFLVMPFIIVMGSSFDNSNQFAIQFPPKSLSLQRYAEIPPKYIDLFLTSLVVASSVAVLAAVLGTCAALAIVRGHLPGKELFNAFFRMPLQIPLIVTGAAMLNFFILLGSMTGFYATRSIIGLILAHLVVALPYTVGAISVVLERMDASLEEAAQSLGANNLITFRKVTFPVIRPGVMVGAFYAFAVSFGDVPVSIFLVNAQTNTLPVEVFNDLQVDFQPHILALSTYVILLSLGIMFVLQKMVGLDFVLSTRHKR